MTLTRAIGSAELFVNTILQTYLRISSFYINTVAQIFKTFSLFAQYRPLHIKIAALLVIFYRPICFVSNLANHCCWIT